LPLPGAPKRIKVLYLMSEVRLYRRPLCRGKENRPD
jgi:hypothetical protein